MEEKYLEQSLLHRRPPGLSPYLSEVLDDVIESLVRNSTPIVHRNLVTPLKRLYRPGADLSPLLVNSSFVAGAPASLHRSVLRRAVVGSVWKRTLIKTLWQCPSLDLKVISRQKCCYPMGFSSVDRSLCYPCRTLYCPNCHCRSALKALDRVSEGLPWDEFAVMVLRVETEFKDTMHGFDAPDFTCCKTVRGRLQDLECVCIRVRGACVSDKVPSSVESYLAAAPVKSAKKVYDKLAKIRSSMSKDGHACTLRAAKTLEKGLALAFRCCPFVLTTLSDVSDANSLLHSVDSYQTMMDGVRRLHCVTGQKILNPSRRVAVSAETATLDAMDLDEGFKTAENGETQ